MTVLHMLNKAQRYFTQGAKLHRAIVPVVPPSFWPHNPKPTREDGGRMWVYSGSMHNSSETAIGIEKHWLYCFFPYDWDQDARWKSESIGKTETTHNCWNNTQQFLISSLTLNVETLYYVWHPIQYSAWNSATSKVQNKYRRHWHSVIYTRKRKAPR
jgi:hypothetical protein